MDGHLGFVGTNTEYTKLFRDWHWRTLTGILSFDFHAQECPNRTLHPTAGSQIFRLDWVLSLRTMIFNSCNYMITELSVWTSHRSQICYTYVLQSHERMVLPDVYHITILLGIFSGIILIYRLSDIMKHLHHVAVSPKLLSLIWYLTYRRRMMQNHSMHPLILWRSQELSRQIRNKIHPTRMLHLCPHLTNLVHVQAELAALFQGARREGVGFWGIESCWITFNDERGDCLFS